MLAAVRLDNGQPSGKKRREWGHLKAMLHAFCTEMVR